MNDNAEPIKILTEIIYTDSKLLGLMRENKREVMNDKVELLPCPFCGSNPELTQDNNPPNNHWWVACYNNKCFSMPQATNVEYPNDNTKQDAIKAWNTRKEAR